MGIFTGDKGWEKLPREVDKAYEDRKRLREEITMLEKSLELKQEQMATALKIIANYEKW